MSYPWLCVCGHFSTDHHWADDGKGRYGDYCTQCDCRELIDAEQA